MNKKKQNVLGLIPARGGSKRVLRKNIRNFLGKPLLAYTIETALKAKKLDRLIVSTEDEEIAEIALKYGAEVPFLRPKELALDQTPDFPVLEHTIKWLFENEDWKADIIVFLRPTCIFRSDEEIDILVKKTIVSDYDSVRAVSEAVYSPYWMKKIEGDLVVPFVETEFEYKRHQDLPPVYQCNGTVDVIRAETILKKRKLYGDRIGFLKSINKFASIDIDTEVDFFIAETAYRHQEEEGL